MTNPKQDFYSYDSRLYNRVIDIIPLKILKWWHKQLFKYDPIIHKVEKLLEPLEGIYYDITRPIRDFYRDNVQCLGSRIKRSMDYAKFAWSTNEYDYSSILNLLEFKLGRMELVIRGGYYLNSKDCADQIRIVKELFKLLVEDEFWAAQDSRYMTIPFSDRESKREVRMTDGGAKQVFYVMETSIDGLDEDTKDEIIRNNRELHTYYNELRVSMLRAICHIITPIYGDYKKKLQENNVKIGEESGIDPDDYWDNMHIFKHEHNGIFSWWS